MEKLDEAVDHFSVSSKFRNVVNQSVWAFFGVYGPHVDNERDLCGMSSPGSITSGKYHGV